MFTGKNKEHSAAYEERPVLNPQSLSKSYKVRTKEENDNLLRLVAEKQEELENAQMSQMVMKPNEAYERLVWQITHLNKRFGYEVAGVIGRKTANSSKCKTFVVGGKFYLGFV